MGHLPDPAYIGGVAVGALIFSFLYWGFGFLRMGTTGFAAQAYGAGTPGELKATLVRPLALGAGLGVLLILVQAPIAWAVFPLLDASEQVKDFAQDYYAIRIWSAPAVLIQYGLVGWLLGVQRAWTAVSIQIAVNGVNIVLDLVLVLVFGWGVEGVAAATVIAEIFGAALGLLLVWRIVRGRRGWDWASIWQWERLLALFRVNLDIFIRTLCLILAFTSFTIQGAGLGDVVLAANVILMSLHSFAAHGLDGFAHAAEILGGSAVGAKDRRTFRRVAVAAGRLALVMSLVIMAVYGVLGPGIIAAYTDIDDVRQTAALYLPWLIASPLISAPGFLLDGIFIGATRTAAMRNAMLLSLLTYAVACVLLVPLWGNHGLWTSLMILMVARAATLGYAYPALERSIDASAPAPARSSDGG